jgi:hypothetical protein
MHRLQLCISGSLRTRGHGLERRQVNSRARSGIGELPGTPHERQKAKAAEKMQLSRQLLQSRSGGLSLICEGWAQLNGRMGSHGGARAPIHE